MLILSTKQQMSLKRNTLVRDLRNRYNEVELSYVTLVAYNVLFIGVNVKKKSSIISQLQKVHQPLCFCHAFTCRPSRSERTALDIQNCTLVMGKEVTPKLANHI